MCIPLLTLTTPIKSNLRGEEATGSSGMLKGTLFWRLTPLKSVWSGLLGDVHVAVVDVLVLVLGGRRNPRLGFLFFFLTKGHM